jgi:hypothetical protein
VASIGRTQHLSTKQQTSEKEVAQTLPSTVQNTGGKSYRFYDFEHIKLDGNI